MFNNKVYVNSYNEATTYIAKFFNTSMRELESIITRICAFASFFGMEISEDLIRSWVKK